MKSKLALASLAMIAILIGVSASPSLFSPSLSSGVAFAQNDNGAPEKGAVQEKAAPKKDAQKKAVQKTEPKKSDTQHKDSQKRSAQKTEPPKANPPKSKRRWFQFSLRTLAVLTLLLGFGTATWIVPI